MNFIGLHGFLGGPQDWDATWKTLQKTYPEALFLAPNLFDEGPLGPTTGLSSWGENFIAWIERQKLHGPIFLFGYSMGGRLALHGLHASPTTFKKVILVSTNLGLADRTQINERQKSDDTWSRQFAKVASDADFRTVVGLWNSQSIFSFDDPEPIRQFNQFNPTTLSLALKSWSLAEQKNFWSSEFLQSTHFVVGGQDQKYLELYEQHCPKGQVHVLPNVGHRVILSSRWPSFCNRTLLQLENRSEGKR